VRFIVYIYNERSLPDGAAVTSRNAVSETTTMISIEIILTIRVDVIAARRLQVNSVATVTRASSVISSSRPHHLMTFSFVFQPECSSCRSRIIQPHWPAVAPLYGLWLFLDSRRWMRRNKPTWDAATATDDDDDDDDDEIRPAISRLTGYRVFAVSFFVLPRRLRWIRWRNIEIAYFAHTLGIQRLAPEQ